MLRSLGNKMLGLIIILALLGLFLAYTNGNFSGIKTSGLVWTPVTITAGVPSTIKCYCGLLTDVVSNCEEGAQVRVQVRLIEVGRTTTLWSGTSTLSRYSGTGMYKDFTYTYPQNGKYAVICDYWKKGSTAMLDSEIKMITVSGVPSCTGMSMGACSASELGQKSCKVDAGVGNLYHTAECMRFDNLGLNPNGNLYCWYDKGVCPSGQACNLGSCVPGTTIPVSYNCPASTTLGKCDKPLINYLQCRNNKVVACLELVKPDILYCYYETDDCTAKGMTCYDITGCGPLSTITTTLQGGGTGCDKTIALNDKSCCERMQGKWYNTGGAVTDFVTWLIGGKGSGYCELPIVAGIDNQTLFMFFIVIIIAIALIAVAVIVKVL